MNATKSKSFKTILITGGAGFIGSNHVLYMMKRYGDSIELHNLDALTYAGNLTNLSSIESMPNYHFHKIDITDTQAVRGLFDRIKFDLIIHFAAESHVDRSIKSSQEFLKTNILGTQVLLDAARDFNVGEFVHISTDEVYGSLSMTDPAFCETTPLHPNSPYSVSKCSSDLLVLAYHETFGLPVKITRCSNNYGPYQFPEKLIPLMISNALENKPLPVYGKGENVRDWIFVEDHCRGVDHVIHHGKIGEVYNLGGNSERRNIDVVKTILSILGKPDTLITYVQDRLGHDFRYAIDYSKLNTLSGWEPTVSFEDGIRQTIQWYIDNQDWWQAIKSGAYKEYYATHYSTLSQ